MSSFELGIAEIRKEFNTFMEATTAAIKNTDKKSDGFMKAAEDSAKALEQCLLLTQQHQEFKKLIEDMEILVSRTSGQDANISKDMLTKADIQSKAVLYDYLRKSKYDVGYKGHMESHKKQVESRLESMYAHYDAESLAQVKKDVMESILTDGGYWTLPPDYLSQRVNRVFETSPIRRLAKIITTSKNLCNLVVDDDQLTGETTGGERTPIDKATTPKVGLLGIPIHHLSTVIYVTDDMLADSGMDIGAWIIDKGTNRLMRVQNEAFLNGTSSNQPQGIMTLPTWGDTAVTIGGTDWASQSYTPPAGELYQRYALQHIYSGAAADIGWQALINIKSSLIEDYQNNAVFLMHRTVWARIMQLVPDSGDGRPFFNYLNYLSTGTSDVLLNKQVVFAANMPSWSGGDFTTGDVPIIYGDFNQGYLIVDRLGLNLLRDPYTESANNLIRYVMKTRYGAAVSNFQALKMMEIGVAS
jgi:HK97 family phage major capsid protein